MGIDQGKEFNMSKPDDPCSGPGEENFTPREQLITDLAWEYCDKARKGQNPKKQEYLERLPDDAAREEFEVLTGFSELVDLTVEIDAKYPEGIFPKPPDDNSGTSEDWKNN